MNKRCDIDALRAWAQILGYNIGKPQMAARHAELLEDAIDELRALRKVAAEWASGFGNVHSYGSPESLSEYYRDFGGDDEQ